MGISEREISSATLRQLEGGYFKSDAIACKRGHAVLAPFNLPHLNCLILHRLCEAFVLPIALLFLSMSRKNSRAAAVSFSVKETPVTVIWLRTFARANS